MTKELTLTISEEERDILVRLLGDMPVHIYMDVFPIMCMVDLCYRIRAAKSQSDLDRADRDAAMLRRGIIPKDYCVGDV